MGWPFQARAPGDGSLTSDWMGVHKDTVCAAVPEGLDLAAQTRRVDGLVQMGSGSGKFAHAVMAAADTGTEWIWLLAPGVAPAPDALERLLSPLGMPSLGRPALLASKVVRPDGHLETDGQPWPRMLAREQSLTGAAHRLVALRAVRYGSILVSRSAIERHGAPRADLAERADDLEWTGRVLRDGAGFLVPQSLVTRAGHLQIDCADDLWGRSRILRGDGWAGQERVWFAYRLVADFLTSSLRHPAMAPRLVRALAGGLASPL